MKKTFFMMITLLGIEMLHAQSGPVIETSLSHQQEQFRHVPSLRSDALAQVTPLGGNLLAKPVPSPLSMDVLNQPQPTVPIVTASKAMDMRLALRDVNAIRQAAKKMGGDIKVTIEPIGVTAEDIYIPLKETGMFDVSIKDNTITVTSKDPRAMQADIDGKIAQLREQQSQLLRNIAVLEQVKSQSTGR